MANNLGQPTIQDVSNVMCDQCNAVICLGCPVYELDKHARAQQNAHLTGGGLCAQCGSPAWTHSVRDHAFVEPHHPQVA